jgi:hypothetical protein
MIFLFLFFAFVFLLLLGSPFWSGPKRAPVPLIFDSADELHLQYIISASNLRAFNYGLKGETDPNLFRKVCSAMKIPEFKPTVAKVATTDAEGKINIYVESSSINNFVGV